MLLFGSFLRGELSFLKLGSVLVGLSGRCQIFLESHITKYAVFEVKCIVIVDWN